MGTGKDSAGNIQYRGIEDVWGNVFEWIDGFNGSGAISYLCTRPSKYADNTSTNYYQSITRCAGNGYISAETSDSTHKEVKLPTAYSGSATTYYRDYAYCDSGWRVVSVGGNRAHGTCGLWFFAPNDASTYANADIGSRLIHRLL